MYNHQIAKAVKLYLVGLAVADKLPLDMTELNLTDLESVIDKAVSAKDKYLDMAGELLCSDDTEEIQRMVNLIANNEDQTELLDYVDGVVVWEKVEFSFTCEQFLEHIGYVND